jgi:tetratricopeptide (TPR) repeat protein
MLLLLMSETLVVRTSAQSCYSNCRELAVAAERSGRLRDAFAYYSSALLANPSADEQQEFREHIIALAQNLNPPPAVPEEAERHLIRGRVALKLSQGPEDLGSAISEFQRALRVAPWLAEGYFNLGLLQEKTKDYSGAIRNFKLYLLAAPKAEDVEAIRKKIIELEYLQERGQTQPASKNPTEQNAPGQTNKGTVRFRAWYYKESLVSVTQDEGSLEIGDGVIRFRGNTGQYSFDLQISDVQHLQPRVVVDVFYYLRIDLKNGKKYGFAVARPGSTGGKREDMDALEQAIEDVAKKQGIVFQQRPR